MKSGNCFTVEYILGNRDNKPKDGVRKEHFTENSIDRDDEKRVKNETKCEVKKEKVDVDEQMITTEKGTHANLFNQFPNNKSQVCFSLVPFQLSIEQLSRSGHYSLTNHSTSN